MTGMKSFPSFSDVCNLRSYGWNEPCDNVTPFAPTIRQRKTVRIVGRRRARYTERMQRTELKRYGMLIGVVALFVFGFFGYLVWSAYGRLTRGEIDIAQYTQPGKVTRSTAAKSASVRKVDRALVETSDDPALGPTDAAVTIVEFADFQCPFSQTAFPIVKDIIAEYGSKVRFQFRDFPLTDINPDAVRAAEAGACANDQGKFWQLHDLLFIYQANLTQADIVNNATQARIDTVTLEQCMAIGKYSSEVQDDFNDGVAAGVTGTPTWFVNGWRIEGVQSFETWKKIIDFGLKGKL